LKVDMLKWMMMKWAPKRYGDKAALEDGSQGLQVKFSWLMPEQAPAVPPTPPKQLEYLPPITDSVDQAILARLIESMRRRIPRVDQRTPGEVVEEVAGIIDSALAVFYRT
jgi:hypothetical protein